jgi:hypothetical protein
MPICPNCQMAYLPGESHHCERDNRPTGQPLSPGWRAVAVACWGAGVGGVAMFGLCMATNSFGPGCVVAGLISGAPIGACVGAVIGYRRATRGGAKWS